MAYGTIFYFIYDHKSSVSPDITISYIRLLSAVVLNIEQYEFIKAIEDYVVMLAFVMLYWDGQFWRVISVVHYVGNVSANNMKHIKRDL